MQEEQRRPTESDSEIVPISELEHILGGNRALRRKFLSNLRRRVKKARKEEARAPKNG